MSIYLSGRFWEQTLERAVKTGAQFVIGSFAQDASGVDLFAVDLGSLAGIGLAGAALSALTSIGTARIGPPDTPSTV